VDEVQNNNAYYDVTSTEQLYIKENAKIQAKEKKNKNNGNAIQQKQYDKQNKNKTNIQHHQRRKTFVE
jgi:hypothetical protein